MKTIILIILCNIISLILINAQKCYVCDQAGCDRPGAGDVKTCSDANAGGTSGKAFVYGALKKGNASTYVYNAIQDEFNSYAASELGLNQTTTPSWNSLTEWVCYKTVDKHRGCLAMGKGLCHDGKNFLKPTSSIGDKITAIMDKAKNSISKMFTGLTGTHTLTDNQKEEISNWFAENYFSKLVNGSTDPQFQLEYCCEGNACNFASMIQISTAILIFLFLSTLMLV